MTYDSHLGYVCSAWAPAEAVTLSFAPAALASAAGAARGALLPQPRRPCAPPTARCARRDEVPESGERGEEPR